MNSLAVSKEKMLAQAWTVPLKEKQRTGPLRGHKRIQESPWQPPFDGHAVPHNSSSISENPTRTDTRCIQGAKTNLTTPGVQPR